MHHLPLQMRMLMDNNIARNYWLTLAAMYGLTISVVAMAGWPWTFIMGGAFILFAVLHSIRYGQVGRVIQGTLATANPGVGIFAGIFSGAAILINGTSIAIWGGAVLGALTFLVMYLYLQRFGRFHQESRETSA